MRDYLYGAIAAVISMAGAYYIYHTNPDDGYDRLPHSDWQCTDVRIDGLSLPLTPVCWEYTRKATK